MLTQSASCLHGVPSGIRTRVSALKVPFSGIWSVSAKLGGARSVHRNSSRESRRRRRPKAKAAAHVLT